MTVFQRHENHSNSRDCPDPSRTQTFFLSNRKHKKKRNSNKTTARLSKRQQEDKGVQQEVAVGVLVPDLRGILEDEEHPLQVAQHPPECWHGHRSMDTTAHPISWPRILCLSTNCNVWHLVLCLQRVKLCPIKIKISTFITLCCSHQTRIQL